MYICIDVGGTKTLIACLDDNGVIVEQTKITTASDYQEFINEVAKVIGSLNHREFIAGAIGIPVLSFNRRNGIAHRFGNLPWQDVDTAKDIEKIVGCRVFAENDAKLGGLSEARLVKDRYSKVLYLTVGTGIGYSVIDNLNIDTAVGDAGGRILLVENEGQEVAWESLVSGQSIVKRYGQLAEDIDDPEIWQKITADLAKGLIKLIAICLPQVIIIGGSVGSYFDKYADFLRRDLASYQLPLVDLPDIKGAERPNEAVVYGCYDYAKQKLNNE